MNSHTNYTALQGLNVDETVRTTPAYCVPGYSAWPVDPTNLNSYMFWSINGAPFNASFYAPYVTQVILGLKLSYYFNYQTQCTSNLMNLVS